MEGNTLLKLQLIKACYVDNIYLMKELISKGAEINATESDGTTLLHIASFHGKLDIVEYLINEGLNVDSMTHDEITPLEPASGKGHLNVVKILLENKANIDHQNKYKNTALQAACYFSRDNDNCLEVIKFMILNKADVNIQDAKGKTAFELCKGKAIDVFNEALDELAAQSTKRAKGSN